MMMMMMMHTYTQPAYAAKVDVNDARTKQQRQTTKKTTTPRHFIFHLSKPGEKKDQTE